MKTPHINSMRPLPCACCAEVTITSSQRPGNHAAKTPANAASTATGNCSPVHRPVARGTLRRDSVSGNVIADGKPVRKEAADSVSAVGMTGRDLPIRSTGEQICTKTVKSVEGHNTFHAQPGLALSLFRPASLFFTLPTATPAGCWVFAGATRTPASWPAILNAEGSTEPGLGPVAQAQATPVPALDHDRHRQVMHQLTGIAGIGLQ